MNARLASAFAVLLLSLPACGTDDDAMTRHQVCERLATVACERIAACEPTVAQTGCESREMARCCPDGVCAELVVADEEHLAACEAAVSTSSCSNLTGGTLPTSCQHLTDPLPMKPGMGSGSGSGSGSGHPMEGDGLLEVTWAIYAGGSSLTCAQFSDTQTVRIVATPPGGTAITRDFSCVDGSALTNLPVGAYSIVAQARSSSGQVVQQTMATTVGVSASGSSSSFTFEVTTSLGGYCTTLANAVCNTCAPSDTTCKTDVINDCCATNGSCGRPAIADPQAFPACVAAFNSGSYCSSPPPVCSGAIDVY